MRHKWQQGTDKGGDRLSDHQWAALICETINQTDSESPSVFQMRLAQEVSFIWRIFDVTLTVRCSSPSRIQKLCSKRAYTIQPTPYDGSTTDGTISSTTKKLSLSIGIHCFMI